MTAKPPSGNKKKKKESRKISDKSSTLAQHNRRRDGSSSSTRVEELKTRERKSAQTKSTTIASSSVSTSSSNATHASKSSSVLTSELPSPSPSPSPQQVSSPRSILRSNDSPLRAGNVDFKDPIVTATEFAPYYNRTGYARCVRRARGCKLCTCCRCTERREKREQSATINDASVTTDHVVKIVCLCREHRKPSELELAAVDAAAPEVHDGTGGDAQSEREQSIKEDSVCETTAQLVTFNESKPPREVKKPVALAWRERRNRSKSSATSTLKEKRKSPKNHIPSKSKTKLTRPSSKTRISGSGASAHTPYRPAKRERTSTPSSSAKHKSSAAKRVKNLQKHVPAISPKIKVNTKLAKRPHHSVSPVNQTSSRKSPSITHFNGRSRVRAISSMSDWPPTSLALASLLFLGRSRPA